MRKILNLLLLMTLMFLLISCSNNEEQPSKESTEPSLNEQETPTVNSPTPDEEEIKFKFTQQVKMTYEFVGDEKDKPGFAQGYITIKPLEGAKKIGYYLVCLANEDGILTEYDEFACIDVTGEEVSYYVKDGRFLPPEATMLVVFQSNYRVPRKLPKIEEAVEINPEYFSTYDPLKAVCDNEAAKAAFETVMPGMLDNPVLSMVMGMKMRDLAQLAGGQFPDALLNAIDVALQKVKK